MSKNSNLKYWFEIPCKTTHIIACNRKHECKQFYAMVKIMYIVLKFYTQSQKTRKSLLH